MYISQRLVTDRNMSLTLRSPVCFSLNKYFYLYDIKKYEKEKKLIIIINWKKNNNIHVDDVRFPFTQWYKICSTYIHFSHRSKVYTTMKDFQYINI